MNDQKSVENDADQLPIFPEHTHLAIFQQPFLQLIQSK